MDIFFVAAIYIIIIVLLIVLRGFLLKLQLKGKIYQTTGTILTKVVDANSRWEPKICYIRVAYKVDLIDLEAELEYPGKCNWVEEGAQVDLVYGSDNLKGVEIVGHPQRNTVVQILTYLIYFLVLMLAIQLLTF